MIDATMLKMPNDEIEEFNELYKDWTVDDAILRRDSKYEMKRVVPEGATFLNAIGKDTLPNN